MVIDSYWTEILRLVRENEMIIEAALFALAFAESIIFVSVFVPSTLIFITIGALEGAAEGPLFPLVIAGAVGALAGDILSFAVGYRMRSNIDTLWGLRHRPALIARARALVARWGIVAVILSKATGPLRPVVPMLAGATSMPLPIFIAVSAVSSVIWSVMVLVPAYYGFNAAVN